jgi:DNA-binding NarL/FixJ family response regulator
VLVITAFGDRDTVVAALNAGADGYLLKDSGPDTILDGIRATLDGGAPISASAAVYLLERLRGSGSGAPEVAVPEAERLTPREIELLELFSRGHSYKLASRALGISPLTVGNHVKSIYRKLQVHSRGEAVYEAVRRKQLSL